MRIAPTRSIAMPVLCLVVFAVAFMGTVTGRVPSIERLLPQAETRSFERGKILEGGKQLVMIYLGSSSCAWANRDDVRAAVREVKKLLAERAARTERPFVTIGVSLDWSIEDGLTHLTEIGEFDEIAVGNKWVNLAAIRYIWHDVPGPASTPQIIVVERTVLAPESKDVIAVRDVPTEALLARKVGAFEILRWVDNGAALPFPRVSDESIGHFAGE